MTQPAVTYSVPVENQSNLWDVLQSLVDTARKHQEQGNLVVSVTQEGYIDVQVLPWIKCPDCGRVSHNPNDAVRGWCGACRAYTSRRWGDVL